MNFRPRQPRQRPPNVIVGLKLRQRAGFAVNQHEERVNSGPAKSSNERVSDSSQDHPGCARPPAIAVVSYQMLVGQALERCTELLVATHTTIRHAGECPC